MKLLQTEGAERTVRLDPRTKMFLLLAVSTVLLLGGSTPALLAVRGLMLLFPFGLLAISGRWRAALLLLVLYFASYALMAVSPGIPFLATGVLNAIVVGSCTVLTRFVPTVATGYFVLSTTTVSEFMAAMERLRAPQWLTIPLSVLFRFFPTLAEEARAIGKAMRMRGVSLARKGPLALVEYRLVPLMACSVRIGEDLSAASLTRGLGAPGKRTNICRIGFHWQDAAVFLVCALALGLLLFDLMCPKAL